MMWGQYWSWNEIVSFTAWGESERERASTASVIVPSSILTPPMPALKAIPTEQKELLAAAET